MKKLFLGLVFLFSLFKCGVGQTFRSENIKKETEKILNTVINSSCFDSVYNHKRVYFLANELLTETSTLDLRRNKCKARILRKTKIKKRQQYAVLGDFTTDWNNPVAARVQLSNSSSKTLNIRLVNQDGKWVIVNHIIFED